MRQERNNKIIAGLLLIAGALLLFKTCTSSDPVDLNQPSNNVKPQHLGSKALRQLENIQTTGNLNFTGKKIAKTTMDADLIALAKVQKKYEASLKKKEDEKKKATKKKKVAKKKTKKKKEVVKEQKKKKPVAQNETDKQNSNDDDFSAGGGRPANLNQNDNTTNDIEIANGYEYWRNLVFSNPSTESIEMLLAAYLQQQIPADWFYRITDDMISSTNGILQESAINLLAMTPSQESFNRLSKVISGRNSQPNLKLLARSSMNDVYKNIAYIGILSNGVRSSDTDVSYNAARLIQISAENNLASNGRGIANSNTATFTQILTILNQVLQATVDDRLRHFAQEAYNYISQHINTRSQFTADIQSEYFY